MARKKRVKSVTKKERAAVGRKIGILRKEGVPLKEALGRAHGIIRQRRKKKKRLTSQSTGTHWTSAREKISAGK